MLGQLFPRREESGGVGVEARVSNEAWTTAMSRLLVTSKENDVSTLFMYLVLGIVQVQAFSLCPCDSFVFFFLHELHPPFNRLTFRRAQIERRACFVRLEDETLPCYLHEAHTFHTFCWEGHCSPKACRFCTLGPIPVRIRFHRFDWFFFAFMSGFDR